MAKNSPQVLIDRALVNQLSSHTDRVALELHEPIYRLLRFFDDARDSRKAQFLNACALAWPTLNQETKTDCHTVVENVFNKNHIYLPPVNELLLSETSQEPFSVQYPVAGRTTTVPRLKLPKAELQSHASFEVVSPVGFQLLQTWKDNSAFQFNQSEAIPNAQGVYRFDLNRTLEELRNSKIIVTASQAIHFYDNRVRYNPDAGRARIVLEFRIYDDSRNLISGHRWYLSSSRPSATGLAYFFLY